MIRQIRTLLATNLDRTADDRDAARKAMIRDLAEAYDTTETEVEQLLAKTLGQSVRDLGTAIGDLQHAAADIIRPTNEEGS